MKILLDAGHYGYQNRSPVVAEYYESCRMWTLCELLYGELQKYGFEVKKTRSDMKKDLAVTERGKMAKGCDLFISLHSNAVSGNQKVDRVDVYAAYDKRNKSHELAAILSKTVSDCMSVTNGGVKTRKSTKGDYEYYGVLRGAASVGCPLYFIIEHSFHTNEYAARWLMSDENLKKLAVAEAKAIAEYFGYGKSETKPETKPETKQNEGKIVLEMSLLKNGARGEEVKTLQTLLKAKGCKGENKKVLSIDGIFGANSEYAVKTFQKSKGIASDGIVGKNTWDRLLKG